MTQLPRVEFILINQLINAFEVYSTMLNLSLTVGRWVQAWSVHNEFAKMRNEAVVATLTWPRMWLEELRKYTKTSVKMLGVLADFRTRCLPVIIQLIAWANMLDIRHFLYGPSRGYITSSVPFQVEKVSKIETINYAHESRRTQIWERLCWGCPGKTENYRTDFSSERAPHINKPETV
jgi:hypothetical protein